MSGASPMTEIVNNKIFSLSLHYNRDFNNFLAKAAVPREGTTSNLCPRGGGGEERKGEGEAPSKKKIEI